MTSAISANSAPMKKRNTPAPGADFVVGEKDFLQHQEDQQRADLAADQGDVLEARIEAAMALIGHFGEIGGAGAVFAAEAQALDDAGGGEQDRRPDADRGVGRRHRDHQRAEAHQRHRQHQRAAPAVMIGKIAEQPAAERTHQKAGGEEERGVELLHHRIGIGKERAGEIERERRIGVEVVPLDEIADRADEDGPDAPPHVGEVERLIAGAMG
jgi:hypothetical protein